METIGKEARIRWVDVTKGILILLVVIGHATSLFNPLIYQFHVGAFFVLSGYTDKKCGKDFIKNIVMKFYRLGCPLIGSFFILLLVSKVVDLAALHPVIFGSEFMGVDVLIKEFGKGNVYISWLGAGWFILVLFGIYLYKGLLDIFMRKWNIYGELVFSILLALLGYLIKFIVGNNIVVLILIAQFFFTFGRFLNETKLLERIFFSKEMEVLGLFISIVTMFTIKEKNICMDFASGDIPELLVTTLMVFNGIIFCYLLSVYICKVNILVKIFEEIGKNTFGILLYHFIGFKIAYIFLIFFRVMNFQEFAHLCPSFDIGKKWWLFITVVSIAFSYSVWKVIINNKITRIIFGQDKDGIKRVIEKLFSNRNVVLAGTVIIMISCFLGTFSRIDVKNIVQVGKQMITKGYYISGQWEDNFLGREVKFIFLPNKNREIEIDLFQPESFGENKVRIYVDDSVYSEMELKSGNNTINVTVNKGNALTLIFDKIFIPAETSQSNDRRELSCVLSGVNVEK